LVSDPLTSTWTNHIGDRIRGKRKAYCHIFNRGNGLEIVYTVGTPWWEHPLILTTPSSLSPL
jgi:hypothetical protein